MAGRFTLFIQAGNPSDESTYYRSDNGGVTWACMQLPTIQSPARMVLFAPTATNLRSV